ncbi:MAG TPA: aminoacetone oxidase family FAD-binding enzyme [Caldimonas sp.]|nr:aminoacetone oxidase family FAD-binding enzyme [Caldimonas sp.]
MQFDVAIAGAGAAGLHCAAMAGQLGCSVVLLDHAEKVAEKIRISGGGRCNFTNIDVGPANFDSENRDFCRSALARYTPRDFIDLVERHGIAWHEKHKGQLFCDGPSAQIIAMLLAECDAGGVQRWQPCKVEAVRVGAGGFELDTARGPVEATRVVVATGGLSIPKIGATEWGYVLARRLGHRIVEPRPGLVPFVCDGPAWQPFAALAGLSLPVRIEAGSGARRAEFVDDLLFTHRGLSGPAALQASTWWRPGEAIDIDLAPGGDLGRVFLEAKSTRRRLGAVLAELLPRRLAEAWLATLPGGDRPVADLRVRDLAVLAAGLHRWQPAPTGTEGYRKAEVTAGGVDTRDLDSRSGESRLVPGLHFIGEVVDVTGWLGGYNFQWAWASAAACARALAADCSTGRGGL